MKDGEVVVEEPVPAEPLRRALERLRRKKGLRTIVCALRSSSKNIRTPQGAKAAGSNESMSGTSGKAWALQACGMQWLEAMDAKAEKNPDKYGLRNLVKYRVKFAWGARWRLGLDPVLPNKKPDRLRQELFSSIMHDWDIVSAHFFLSEAVIRGQQTRPRDVHPHHLQGLPRLREDLRAGAARSCTFLKDIAEWYGVTVDEAKMGCHILHNQAR